MSAGPEIVPLGATALLARFGDRIDAAITMRIARLVARLERLQAGHISVGGNDSV